jgi:predicted transcriptional regulator
MRQYAGSYCGTYAELMKRGRGKCENTVRQTEEREHVEATKRHDAKQWIDQGKIKKRTKGHGVTYMTTARHVYAIHETLKVGTCRDSERTKRP